MTTTKPKKSLPLVTKTMLPEVLPDPRRTPGTASAPRHRTMAHMQRLLATAAAVGVAGAGTGAVAVAVAGAAGAATAGCGKSTKVPDGKPDPDNNGNTSGYAVVDPMPPPAHCPGVAQTVAASAKFIAGDAGAALLVVRFPNPKGRDDYKYVKDALSVSYGGAVLKTEVNPDAVIVTIRPEATAQNATITVKGHCDAGPSSIMAQVRWTGPIKEGTAATISLNDMYDY